LALVFKAREDIIREDVSDEMNVVETINLDAELLGMRTAEPASNTSVKPLLLQKASIDPTTPLTLGLNINGISTEAPAASVVPTAGKIGTVKPLPTAAEAVAETLVYIPRAIGFWYVKPVKVKAAAPSFEMRRPRLDFCTELPIAMLPKST